MPLLDAPANERLATRDDASKLDWDLARRTHGGDGALQLEVPVLGTKFPVWVGKQLSRDVTERYLDLKVGASVIALTSTKPQGQRLIIIATPTGRARRPVHADLLEALVDQTLARLSTSHRTDETNDLLD